MVVKNQRYESSFVISGMGKNDVPNIQNISEVSIVNAVAKQFHPKRQTIARNQISPLIKKLKLHPKKRVLYIMLIKDLVEIEINRIA